jgi:hypothetical protein
MLKSQFLDGHRFISSGFLLPPAPFLVGVSEDHHPTISGLRQHDLKPTS